MKCRPVFKFQVWPRNTDAGGLRSPHKTYEYAALREAYSLVKEYIVFDGLMRISGQDDLEYVASTLAAMDRDCVKVVVNRESMIKLRASWRHGFRPAWHVVNVKAYDYGIDAEDTYLAFVPLIFTIDDSARSFELMISPYKLRRMKYDEWKDFSHQVGDVAAQLEALRAAAKL